MKGTWDTKGGQTDNQWRKMFKSPQEEEDEEQRIRGLDPTAARGRGGRKEE